MVFCTKRWDNQKTLLDSEPAEMVLSILHLLLSHKILTLGKHLRLLRGVGLNSALGNGCLELLHNLGAR